MTVLVDLPVRIDRHAIHDSFADDVRLGLSRELKELSPKYFYDARGSELFDRITTLPEYYPTRCERSIINRYAPLIVDGSEELIELGSGTASKTRALLYAMAGAGALRRYVPFDVDESIVETCALELVDLYPGLRVHGVVGDFQRDLVHLPDGRLCPRSRQPAAKLSSTYAARLVSSFFLSRGTPSEGQRAAGTRWTTHRLRSAMPTSGGWSFRS